jgi:hypothetical protein
MRWDEYVELGNEICVQNLGRETSKEKIGLNGRLLHHGNEPSSSTRAGYFLISRASANISRKILYREVVACYHKDLCI